MTSRNIILVSLSIEPLLEVAPPTLLSDGGRAGHDLVVSIVLRLSDAVLHASLITLILKIPDVLDGILDQSRADGGRVIAKAVDDVVVVHVAHCSRSVGVVKGFR
jgi:hypothetical protein